MKMKKTIKNSILNIGKQIIPPKYRYAKWLYKHTKEMHCMEIDGKRTLNYFMSNRKNIKLIPVMNKAEQIAALISAVDICPANNQTFFYSIDCFKTIDLTTRIFDNYSVDYTWIVNCSIKDIENKFVGRGSSFSEGELLIIEALKGYLCKLKNDQHVFARWQESILAIESLFERPANTFFEALQRILFFNQFIWQTRHKDIGLGHLDWILQDIYEQDLKSGNITQIQAKEYLKQFFIILHEFYWFKSWALMGDTGQIIILGGLGIDGEYKCSSLSYLFIDVAKELQLPDPKVFLRCSATMPNDLLERALDCISTGIGCPFLSNDDVVIPSLVKANYELKDAYNYGASACWEPLIPGISCEQNNAMTFNFAKPLLDLLDSDGLKDIKCMSDFISSFKNALSEYVRSVLEPMTYLEFEEDPILSLISEPSIINDKDITRGGAKYSNIGLTSVGLGSTVNSILNIKQIVFDNQLCSLSDLNGYRKNNFIGNEKLLGELGNSCPRFGSDDEYVVSISREIMQYTENEFSKYTTKFGGKFKIGLSSPSYISAAKDIPATFDGRRNGDPFSTHISSDRPIPITELLSFASKLDYSGLKCNGNVVDFIVNPDLLKNNLDKYVLLVESAFAQGVFQMQMNVVSSKTLIAAKEHPEQFPNLIVRVWGFSAYFKDLPDEYKDVLIQRAIESEKAA